MPQLDFTTYVPQLIWLLISFGLLYLLMSRVALPRIATVIEERRDRIADDLDTAEQLRLKADETIAAYEEALAKARSDAHAIAQQKRDEMTAETDRQRKELEAELEQRLEAAEKSIAETKQAAMQNVEGIAVDVAQSITDHLLGGATDRQAAESAVKAELA